jgi:hypothetical protein
VLQIPSTAKPDTPASKLAGQLKKDAKEAEAKPVQGRRWPGLCVPFFVFVPILLFAGKSGLLSMLMRKKEDDQPAGKKDEDEDDEATDTYQQDKPPEKTPEPTTQPVWRPPASRQQTKSLTENFPCDLRESWCELRMYICSTGDDFLSERTAIVNALLPELQVRCASRRIRISAVDCWTSTGSSLSFPRECRIDVILPHNRPSKR